MRTQVRTGAVDARIAAIAAGQYGVVGRGQLTGLGLEPGAIGRRLRGGRLHRLHWGVYAVGHAVLSPEGRWMAAVLACGPRAVLSHRSAAAHWGLRGYRGPIDVTAPSKTKSRGAIRRHCTVLPPDEVTVERKIPVTTVPRIIFDLAATAGVDVAERALRESEYLRLHDALSLPDLIARYPRHRGARAVRECLARLGETPGRLRGWLEEEFLPFLDRYGLPRPHLNVWLEVGVERLEVDCLWPDRRVVVELDGFAAHGTRVAFRKDRARDRKLRVAGYDVTRVATEQLTDEPDALAADLRKLLEATPRDI